MNQLMRVGRGVVFAIDHRVSPQECYQLGEQWRRVLPDVPMIVVPEARVVIGEGEAPLLFEFTGDVTPTFIAEFKLWWETMLTSPDTLVGA